MKTIPLNFINAVMIIGERLPDGTESWDGSAFVIKKKAVKPLLKDAYYLITNKHCVEYKTDLLVRCSFFKKDASSDFTINLVDENGKLNYSPHPNPEIDVVAIMLDEKNLDDPYGLGYFDLDVQSLTLNQMMALNIYEGAPIYAMGFPIDLIGEIKSPTCVSGCISKILDTYFDKSLEDDSYLADVRTYPGHSGGPIICMAETDSSHSVQPKLIGILKGPILYEDDVLDEHLRPTGKRELVSSRLTQVFPVDDIIEVVDLEWRRHNSNNGAIAKTA